MVDYGYGIVGYVLNLICLVSGLVLFVISLMVVAIIIYHQYKNRLKRGERITLILSANIYLVLFIDVITMISFNIQTLIGDVYGNNFDSSWCIIRGYFLCITAFSMYHSFVIQAFFRLSRIVYSNYRWLQFSWFYMIIAPILLVGAGVLLCPALIWNGIIYLPNDYVCFISFTNIRAILWVAFISYGLPVTYLSLIYIRITLFLQQQSNDIELAIKRRQKRDLVAIQRIFINFGILLASGLPGTVVIIMSLIYGVEYPLSHRILLIGVEVSLVILSIQMILMTPQLKNIVIKRWQQNRVTPIDGTIQMRPIPTAQ